MVVATLFLIAAEPMIDEAGHWVRSQPAAVQTSLLKSLDF
jgi:hypothetical protein